MEPFAFLIVNLFFSGPPDVEDPEFQIFLKNHKAADSSLPRAARTSAPGKVPQHQVYGSPIQDEQYHSSHLSKQNKKRNHQQRVSQNHFFLMLADKKKLVRSIFCFSFLSRFFPKEEDLMFLTFTFFVRKVRI